jgi:hypothetical protein
MPKSFKTPYFRGQKSDFRGQKTDFHGSKKRLSWPEIGLSWPKKRLSWPENRLSWVEKSTFVGQKVPLFLYLCEVTGYFRKRLIVF